MWPVCWRPTPRPITGRRDSSLAVISTGHQWSVAELTVGQLNTSAAMFNALCAINAAKPAADEHTSWVCIGYNMVYS